MAIDVNINQDGTQPVVNADAQDYRKTPDPSSDNLLDRYGLVLPKGLEFVDNSPKVRESEATPSPTSNAEPITNNPPAPTKESPSKPAISFARVGNVVVGETIKPDKENLHMGGKPNHTNLLLALALIGSAFGGGIKDAHAWTSGGNGQGNENAVVQDIEAAGDAVQVLGAFGNVLKSFTNPANNTAVGGYGTYSNSTNMVNPNMTNQGAFPGGYPVQNMQSVCVPSNTTAFTSGGNVGYRSTCNLQ